MNQNNIINKCALEWWLIPWSLQQLLLEALFKFSRMHDRNPYECAQSLFLFRLEMAMGQGRFLDDSDFKIGEEDFFHQRYFIFNICYHIKRPLSYAEALLIFSAFGLAP